MKIHFLFLFNILVFFSCISQKSINSNLYNCNDLVYSNDHKKLKLKDCIDSLFFNKKKLISKYSDLEKIQLFISNYSLLIFKNKKYEISIEFSKDSIIVDSTYQFSDDNTLNNMLFIQEKFGNNFFGNYKETGNKISFERINFISITENDKVFTLPDSLFRKFINPNIFHKYMSLNPIEIYFDNKKNMICLYIMGKIKVDYDGNTFYYDQSSPSYINKIIFDLKTKTPKNIFITSKILNKYGWPFCDNFWPF